MKQIMVYVVDTTPVVEKSQREKPDLSVKNIFKLDHEHGGLEENSIWMSRSDYYFALQKVSPHETVGNKQYVQRQETVKSLEH